MASRSQSPSSARPIQVKLVLLGQAATGKSSLVLRFVNNEFQENKEPTIGGVIAAFLTQKVKLTEDVIKFEIWDTAGQERFHSLAPMYYRNSQASVVVFDVTKPATLQKAKSWVKELQRQANTNIIIALAGNKTDLASERQVTHEEASQYAEENGLLYYETSAKTGENVQEMFTEIAQKIPKEYIMHERRSKSAASGLISPSPAIELDQPGAGRGHGQNSLYDRSHPAGSQCSC